MIESSGEAIRDATRQLDGTGSPRLEAEILLGHVLRCARSALIAHPERELSQPQRERYTALVARRVAGEPIAHLTGEREFWSLSLQLCADVLIPRPETEHLVEAALSVLPPDTPAVALDAGTGSGAIALAMASERSRVHVIASDRCARALHVAHANARRLHLPNLHFVCADWLAPFAPASIDLIVSNPPYLCANDPHLERGDLRYEPRAALVATKQGLDDLYRLVDTAATPLRRGGWLWLEHGAEQADTVGSRLHERGYREIRTLKDWAGHPRVSGGQWPGRVFSNP